MRQKMVRGVFIQEYRLITRPVGLESLSSNRGKQSIGRSNGINPPIPQVIRPRSLSPPDTSVKIDPALAEIASQAPAENLPEIPAPSFWLPDHQGDYGALGEMGGKRKKLPHERAGWKEMDEAGPRKRGPRKKDASAPSGSAVPATSAGTTGEMDDGAGHLERDLMEAHRQNGGEEDGMYQTMGLYPTTGLGSYAATQPEGGQSGGEDGDLDEQGKKRKRAPSEAKEARAEQNRRAQQAFRRRREEKMKGLEAAAAALEPTQRRLQEVESKLIEAALSLEASKIQCQAYQSALRTVAQASGYSIITDEGTLAINSSMQTKAGLSDAKEIDAACATLARQSRELAKQNRIRRGF
ncbi:hypothetical protein BD324DRAFT_627336 [Kockovaella imperatae]|uniref:BZIP domain-containing protein n=1 Tax=Kockovaella imperatae TaxID=4999 RepID=A0A1Y1UFP2_9TREE|nr:hypothetical protein BD324DRAFT_627336 [Kockovaella imperatae]ORX36832.1 hypothetical protein BD324DRAFT_627336 [Kockovaella imperatae]